MDAEEANPDPTLLTGNIFISRVATKALLDSGATRTFLSEIFVNNLGVKSIGLDASYSVTVPSREELSASSVVRDIELESHGHLVYVDLIVLPMPKFDIILGVDWLMKYIVLSIFSGGILSKYISATDVPTPSLSDVLVFRDIPDVFPDDVTSISPERKVKFAIDLMPCTVAISKAPYRLALAEML
ncbi:uncharacterized protein [Primulina huaijiensis]|uniref:uncharacterized protein n=1 Tax=Primulina huaijiensis TaxID=1492673 RepID=UPI003CC78C52